jgi:hypothetical protein
MSIYNGWACSVQLVMLMVPPLHLLLLLEKLRRSRPSKQASLFNTPYYRFKHLDTTVCVVQNHRVLPLRLLLLLVPLRGLQLLAELMLQRLKRLRRLQQKWPILVFTQTRH